MPINEDEFENYVLLPEGLSWDFDSKVFQIGNLSINTNHIKTWINLFNTNGKINENLYDTNLPEGLSWDNKNNIFSIKNLNINTNFFQDSTNFFEDDGKINTILYNHDLPEGLSYKNGVFTIHDIQNTTNCGLMIENLLSIDKKTTESNLRLENIGKGYQIKTEDDDYLQMI